MPGEAIEASIDQTNSSDLSDNSITTLIGVKRTLPPVLKLIFTHLNSKPVLTILLIISLSVNILMVLTYTVHVGNRKSNGYNIFSAKPLTMTDAETSVDGQDIRAVKIDKVFEKYKCPLAGYGKDFVKAADEYNIPYWLLPALSFQESKCGKKTPLKDAEETYNAYGWAVWGDNIQHFESWEDGIDVVSKYMSDKFFSQGTTEPCDIMKIYTPPSDGTWCKGINYFGNMIKTYNIN